MKKYKVTKKEFTLAGGISNPKYCRMMRNGKWTYWRIF